MKRLSWDEVDGRRLAWHALLEPQPAERLPAVVSSLGAIQAQVMTAAELALGARVAGITRHDVQAEIAERRLVKTYSLRGTVHLHRAEDIRTWIAARHALPDWQEGRWHDSYRLNRQQAQSVLAAMADALDGRGLTRDDFAREVAGRAGSWARERLASTWADLIGLGFDAGLLCFGPSQGSQVTFVRLDQWIGAGPEVDPQEAAVQVCRRYLESYGPARPRDFAQWFAGARLKPEVVAPWFDALRPELEEIDVEDQRAWMLVGDEAGPAGGGYLRLLPQYDAYVLGCRFGREVIVPEAARARLFAFKNGRFEGASGLPVLLVDGVVAGMWERRPRGQRVEIRVEPFRSLSPAQRQQLEVEAERTARFLGLTGDLWLGTLGMLPPSRQTG